MRDARVAARNRGQRCAAVYAEFHDQAFDAALREREFEHLVHTRRRAEGELSVERISESWLESQSELFGDSVQMTEGYGSWWSYIPHFINTPGYVYAYAYGQLLALSVYGRYLKEGEAFAPAYLDLLAAGGSRGPEELAAMVGIDLADPGFWDAGLDLVENQLTAAEDLAKR